MGSFLDEVGSGLSSRYLAGLVDKGFDDVRSLAVGEDKLIEHVDMLNETNYRIYLVSFWWI